jgi:hypothetical protein
VFLLAALAREFTDIRRLVIVSDRSYVGMLSVSTVLSRLGLMHRDLERFAARIRDMPSRAPDPAQALNEAFAEWWKLWPDDKVKEGKHSIWVTTNSLAAWFGEAMHSGAVEIDDIEKATLIDLLRIHDYPNDFVPVKNRVDSQPDGQKPAADGMQWSEAPVAIVDSRSLNDRLAQQYLTELMDRNRLR